MSNRVPWTKPLTDEEIREVDPTWFDRLAAQKLSYAECEVASETFGRPLELLLNASGHITDDQHERALEHLRSIVSV